MMFKVPINKKGFTLVEIILASVILCGAVLTLGAISTRSLTATKLNREYELAAALADRQLTIIDYIGIENFIESQMTEGEFDQLEPKYRWEVQTEPLDTDNLYRVTVIISWNNQKRLYSISVDTMLNGTGMLGTLQ